jgi:hypothetical protein
MAELAINETVNDLVVAGDDNTLDITIEQQQITINNDDELVLSPVSVGLELKSDDVSLELIQPEVQLLTTGEQGPMGPAGTGGSPTLQTIFEQITDDYGYRGDADLGVLTSQPKWQIRKIVILGDGTPDELYADSDAGFIHVWDDRAGLNY